MSEQPPIEAVTDEGMIRFGKDDEKSRPPRIGTGLLELGTRQEPFMGLIDSLRAKMR